MAARVIWHRTIDHGRIAQRRDRFRRRFFVPATLMVAAVLVLAGPANAIGVAIVVGLVGLVWGSTVRFQSLSDAANPTIEVENGRLRVGRAEVILEDVRRYTTLVASTQTSLFGRHSRLDVGKAVFRMNEPGGRREPDLIELGWPNMGEVGVAEIRTALEAELPGKWVAPTDLVTEEELRSHSRRRRF